MATNEGEENKDENLNSANESDDTFGLPDIEYEPINREESQEEPQQEEEQSSEYVAPQPVEEQPASSYQQQSSYATSGSSYKKQAEEEESSSMGIKILGIIVILLIAGGAAYYFMKYLPDQKEKEKQEQLANEKAEQERKAREAEAERQRLAMEAAEQKRLDSLAAIPKEGTIETLSQRTGRYYVVVSSAVDDDLIMDYAKKLSDKGVSSKIIPPYGKYKFYRIAIADGESFNEAQQKADEMKSDYSDALWVLKY